MGSMINLPGSVTFFGITRIMKLTGGRIVMDFILSMNPLTPY